MHINDIYGQSNSNNRFNFGKPLTNIKIRKYP